jgi:hypothetical protein
VSRVHHHAFARDLQCKCVREGSLQSHVEDGMLMEDKDEYRYCVFPSSISILQWGAKKVCT